MNAALDDNAPSSFKRRPRSATFSRVLFGVIAVFLLVTLLAIASAVLGPAFFSDETRASPLLSDVACSYLPDGKTTALINSHYLNAKTQIILKSDGIFALKDISRLLPSARLSWWICYRARKVVY